MKKCLIFLVLLVFAVLYSTLTLADSCCLPGAASTTNTGLLGTSCVNYPEPYEGGVTFPDETSWGEACTTVFEGVLETSACSNFEVSPDDRCQAGCCCQYNQTSHYIVGSGQTVDKYACDITQPDLSFIPSNKLDCDQVCSGSTSNNFNIYGIVYDNTGVVPQGGVDVTIPGGTAITNAQGAYQFNVAENTYTITADDGTCSGTIQVTLAGGDITDADITLDNCAPAPVCGDGIKEGSEDCDLLDFGTPPQTCTGLGFNGGGNLACNTDCTYDTSACQQCVSNWICDWSRPDYECGFATNCVDLNLCSPASTPMPTVRLPCPPVQATCNNGILEPGEECDGSTNGLGCTDLGYGSGTLTCDQNTCEYDESQCEICPEDPPLNPLTSCSAEQCAVPCSACVSAGFCQQTSCDTMIASITQVRPVQAAAESQVIWEYDNQLYSDCGTDIDLVVVERCVGRSDDCDLNVPNTQSFTLNQPSYTQSITWTDVGPLTPSVPGPTRNQYCYKVFTYINVGGGNQVITESNVACFETGYDMCMQPHRPELCSQNSLTDKGCPESGLTDCNQRIYCDINNMPELLYTGPHTVKPGDVGPFDCGEDPCLGPFDPNGHTVCGQEMICDYCNSLFGMNSYLGDLQVYYNDGFTKSLVPCSNAEISAAASISFAPTCYPKSTTTVADELDDCSEVRSCYDYHDEESCLAYSQQGHCGNLQNTCEWKSLNAGTNAESIGEELGIGVCVPTDTDLQDCDRCNDDKQNSPGCTESLCYIYSTDDSCYYDDDNSYPQIAEMPGMCRNSDEMGCAYYDTQEDCINSDYSANTNCTNPLGCNAIVDVDYEVDPSTQRREGTHVFTQRSKDRFDYGSCQWYPGYGIQEPKCFKNTDNYLRPTPSTPYFSFNDDCFEGNPFFSSPNNYPSLRCFSDNIPPTTTITLRAPIPPETLPVYGSKENLIFSTTVDDNSYDQGETRTWYSLTPSSQYYAPLTNFPSPPQTKAPNIVPEAACNQLGGICTGEFAYACGDGEWVSTTGQCLGTVQQQLVIELITLPAQGGNAPDPSLCAWKVLCDPPTETVYPNYELADLTSLELVSGEQILSYYSEDVARNLELINTVDLLIDATPPYLENFDYDNNSYQNANEQWFTDLTITYDMTDDHGPTTCEGVLEGFSGQTGLTGDQIATGTSFQQFYPSLTDDLYIFTMNCSDVYNNVVVYTKEIVIEADKSITNRTPFMEVFEINTVDISIETQSGADCYYSSLSTEPVTNPQGGNLNEEGQFLRSPDGLMHTATVTVPSNDIHIFATGCDFDNGNLVEGNPGDVIIFSIDQLPSATTLIDYSTGEEYAPDGSVYVRELRLTFDCDDSHDDLILHNGQNPFNLFFGAISAGTVDYCIGPSSAPCTLEEAINLPITITPNTIAGGNDHIYYRCTDLGGNVEATNTQRLFVRNPTFEYPKIRICEPGCDPTIDPNCCVLAN